MDTVPPSACCVPIPPLVVCFFTVIFCDTIVVAMRSSASCNVFWRIFLFRRSFAGIGNLDGGSCAGGRQEKIEGSKTCYER